MSELTVIKVPGEGAEDVLVDAEGSVLTGTADGAVLKIRPDGARIDRIGNTGGRPLGLEWLTDGRVLVCDADRVLLALDAATGRIETLTERVHGRRMLVCNNAAVHSDGTVYFSDSSMVHPLERWKADLAENTRTGRLLRRHPDGEVEVLLTGLRFANGVALPADESFVAVAESAGRTVVRLWLTGPKAGERDHLVGCLPGYPDNISRGTDNVIWVSISSPSDAMLERVMAAPMPVRKLAWRLPGPLQPKPRQTVRVMAFDDEGHTVHDRSLDASHFHMVTGVREHHGRVWLGSVEEPAVATFTL